MGVATETVGAQVLPELLLDVLVVLLLDVLVVLLLDVLVELLVDVLVVVLLEVLDVLPELLVDVLPELLVDVLLEVSPELPLEVLLDVLLEVSPELPLDVLLDVLPELVLVLDELLVPQAQAPQPMPSALQAWPPTQAPGPTQVWVAPGVQTLLPLEVSPPFEVVPLELPPVPKSTPLLEQPPRPAVATSVRPASQEMRGDSGFVSTRGPSGHGKSRKDTVRQSTPADY